MHVDPSLVPFAIALFIGALIGLEREKRKVEGSATGVGGLRTFILFAMAGAVSAWLSQQFAMPWVFLVGLVCTTIVVMTGYAVYAVRHSDAHGLTTEVAAVVTYLLGGVAMSGHPELAVALAITTSAVLAYKQPLHRAVGWLGEADLHAILKLLIATFIVLPVLPDRTVDPWGALNPYKMWWLVILISGLSLVGYVATRWMGERRALPLTGLFGGLVSSTAVSLAFARRSREQDAPPGWADALASGVLLSWAVMFGRVVALVVFVNTALLHRILPAVTAMGVLTLVLGIALMRRVGRTGTAEGGAGGTQVVLRNPFSLTSAIKFALFFAAVLLLVKVVEHYAPGQGVYAVAALAGLTDVDAITLSMAAYGRDAAHAAPAVTAILIAMASNTLVKCGLVAALGSRTMAVRIFLGTGLILAAGTAAWWFTPA